MVDDAADLSALRNALQLACESQNVGNIQRGHAAIAVLPQEFVLSYVAKVAKDSLDLTDEWEYRRLLELLQSVNAQVAFDEFVAIGLESRNEEIKEAAVDFSNESGRNP